MNEYILQTIRELLGIKDPEYTHFDNDLIIHINSAFSTLFQLGVGDKEHAFRITGQRDKWSDFIKDKDQIESVKDYVYLKVRMIFDPPSSSSTMEAYKSAISELEWRLNVADDDLIESDTIHPKDLEEEVNWGD